MIDEETVSRWFLFHSWEIYLNHRTKVSKVVAAANIIALSSKILLLLNLWTVKRALRSSFKKITQAMEAICTFAIILQRKVSTLAVWVPRNLQYHLRDQFTRIWLLSQESKTLCWEAIKQQIIYHQWLWTHNELVHACFPLSKKRGAHLHMNPPCLKYSRKY